MSPNAQVVHGIPNDKPLQEGDIISIDCGALKNGFYGDHAYTFAVGEIEEETRKLLEVTKQSLYEGIRQLKVGNRVGDVGYAIQKYCEDRGYGVVRELGWSRTWEEKCTKILRCQTMVKARQRKKTDERNGSSY